MSRTRVGLVEPFYAGSHKYWVDHLQSGLDADVTVFTLPGRHWKWRMSAGAISLAAQLNAGDATFDVLLVTDMLDVAVFKGLLAPKYQNTPVVLYMHENQVVYPYQTESTDKNWDRHYGLINYKSILAADQVWFNSQFHLDIFFEEMEAFLRPFPESKELIRSLKSIKEDARVIPLGIECTYLDSLKAKRADKPTVLWNHRWEYDKDPKTFFEVLYQLSDESFDFDLIVCGEHYKNQPEVFAQAKVKLAKHIRHWGYFQNREAYVQALWQSTILPVTSNQEFFGLSVLEAIYCGVQPVLPNRLSYSNLYSGLDVFYQSKEGLLEALRTHFSGMTSRSYRSSASHYDWSNVLPLYDAGLADVIKALP